MIKMRLIDKVVVENSRHNTTFFDLPVYEEVDENNVADFIIKKNSEGWKLTKDSTVFEWKLVRENGDVLIPT